LLRKLVMQSHTKTPILGEFELAQFSSFLVAEGRGPPPHHCNSGGGGGCGVCGSSGIRQRQPQLQN